MILLHFQNCDASPTGKTPVKLRFSVRDGRPVLHYAHGSRTLTREAWQALDGASIEATTDRDRRIVSECLGLPP